MVRFLVGLLAFWAASGSDRLFQFAIDSGDYKWVFLAIIPAIAFWALIDLHAYLSRRKA